MTNWTGTQKRVWSSGLSRPGARSKRHSMSIVGDYWQQPTGAAHTALWERKGDQTDIRLKLILSNSGALFRVFWV